MKALRAVTLLGVLAGCSHSPPKSGATEPAVVVVRECFAGGERGDAGFATIYATPKAIRMDVHCGRRPFRVVYRAGEEQYVHYEVNAKQSQLFTTDQVKELAELRKSIAAASKGKGEGKVEDRRVVAALLASADDAMSPLEQAKFKPASIGETNDGVHCRRYEVCSDDFIGEACLARAKEFGVEGGSFAAFAAARKKFRGLLGTAFEIFDPLRKVDGVDYLVVRMTFGNGARGIAVPRLRSVAVQEVPVELWDPNRIEWSVNE